MNNSQLRGAMVVILLLGLILSLSSHAFGYDPETRIYTLKSRDDLERSFPDKWIEIARLNRIDRAHLFKGLKIKIPAKLDGYAYDPLPEIWTEAALLPKFVLIDLRLQFLGAYEYGKLKYSFPISSGKENYNTPPGRYYIFRHNKDRYSSKYFISNTTQPYPMTWSLQLSKDKKNDTAYFIHGRDLDGKPASHGCIGLYDEEMQKKYYGYPQNPTLLDAQKLYLWIVASKKKTEGKINGPMVPVRIIGKAP